MKNYGDLGGCYWAEADNTLIRYSASFINC